MATINEILYKALKNMELYDHKDSTIEKVKLTKEGIEVTVSTVVGESLKFEVTTYLISNISILRQVIEDE